jgi:hypothetical protein
MGSELGISQQLVGDGVVANEVPPVKAVAVPPAPNRVLKSAS